VKVGVLVIRAGVAAPVGAAGLRGTEWWAGAREQGRRDPRAARAAGRRGRIESQRYGRAVPQARPARQVDVVVGGISTGDPGARSGGEDLGTPWLSWDGTTQKGVEETMPNPKWAFKSVDNEVEAIVAGILTPKYFKGIKTVAGIGNDYSYGHDCWESYQAVLKRYVPDVKFVLELFPG
jgi:branched-chain amino acid transport system substrate-binding protein